LKDQSFLTRLEKILVVGVTGKDRLVCKVSRLMMGCNTDLGSVMIINSKKALEESFFAIIENYWKKN
jgi:hypothetical protein